MSDGMDGIGLDWLSYTAVTPRASLQSDANKRWVGEPDSNPYKARHLDQLLALLSISRISKKLNDFE